ncbi:MAG: hypothetical protein WCP55_19090 [Lentisphaerota bacterium]
MKTFCAENKSIQEELKAVLAAESEAKALVASANAEAERIIREAEAKAQMLTTQSMEQTRRDADDMIDTSIRNAERGKQEKLLQVKNELKAKTRLEDAVLEEVVAAAVRKICGGGAEINWPGAATLVISGQLSVRKSID